MKVTRRRIRLFPPVKVPSSSREEERRDLPDREPGDDDSLVAGGDGSVADPKQNLSFVISPLFVRSRGFVRSLVCAAANTSCGHRSKYSDSGLRKLNVSATRYEGGTDILLVHRRFPLLPAVV
jgi:hypothetical protein